MEVVSQLEGMGFSRELAEQAVVSTESSQSSPSLQAALDWLLQLCQTRLTRTGASVGYVQATRTSLPRTVRAGGAGSPARRAPRTERTGYAHQPRAYRYVPRNGTCTVATQVPDASAGAGGGSGG